MIKIMKKSMLMGLALAAAGVSFSAPAAAQATRTWVSGDGDDVNPCSRSAPCKTFAGAIPKTAAGGEINCLNPGGYGAVTINKSITIDCHYTEGGVLAGGNGITINDSATASPNSIVVVLRGLDIFGVNPPLHGVNFVSGAALHIEDSTIRRFNRENSFGVRFSPASAARLYISNTTITDNGGSSTGGGIDVSPTGGSARVILKNLRVRNNTNEGIRTSSANGAVSVVLEGSDLSGNGRGLAALGGANVNVTMVNDSTITNNSIIGVVTTENAVARIDNTTITSNRAGISAEGASQILSYGGNRLDQNPPFNPGTNLNGTFSNATPISRK